GLPLAEHLDYARMRLRKLGRARPAILPADFSGVLRPVTCMAMVRKTSLLRWFEDTSAIIWPLLAAVPNVAASKASWPRRRHSTDVANSTGWISGRRGRPSLL